MRVRGLPRAQHQRGGGYRVTQGQRHDRGSRRAVRRVVVELCVAWPHGGFQVLVFVAARYSGVASARSMRLAPIELLTGPVTSALTRIELLTGPVTTT
jgi:hypothetical protein